MKKVTHEDLINEIRKSAISKVRHEKRQRQHIFFVLPFGILILLIMIFSVYSLAVSDEIKTLTFFTVSVEAHIFIQLFSASLAIVGITFSFFSPFGKISEEKVIEYFREELSKRMANHRKKINEMQKKLPQLQEELKILGEVDSQCYYEANRSPEAS